MVAHTGQGSPGEAARPPCHPEPPGHPERPCTACAYRQGVDFRVIVADAGPRYEGRDLVKRLLAAGVTCDYANLHAVSYVMAEVGKVLLGKPPP